MALPKSAPPPVIPCLPCPLRNHTLRLGFQSGAYRSLYTLGSRSLRVFNRVGMTKEINRFSFVNVFYLVGRISLLQDTSTVF